MVVDLFAPEVAKDAGAHVNFVTTSLGEAVSACKLLANNELREVLETGLDAVLTLGWSEAASELLDDKNNAYIIHERGKGQVICDGYYQAYYVQRYNFDMADRVIAHAKASK